MTAIPTIAGAKEMRTMSQCQIENEPIAIPFIVGYIIDNKVHSSQSTIVIC